MNTANTILKNGIRPIVFTPNCYITLKHPLHPEKTRREVFFVVNVAQEGIKPISMEICESIEVLLKEKFPEGLISVTNLGGNHPHDLTGTQSHVGIHVKSPQFVGMTLVRQHQMVMEILKERFQQDLHAVQIKTEVP